MSSAINAVQALVNHFSANQTLAGQLSELFESPQDFLTKVKSFDQIFAKHAADEPVKEYAFDLMMAHHLEESADDEDYFDSKEWQDIEDKTIERGTELLNLLLYVNESGDAGVDVNVEDFLYEFLLVDEDEFQDEHRIYEELIANQELVEEELDIIVEVGKRIPEDLEIKELFVPTILFFQDPEVKSIGKEHIKKLLPVEQALLATLLAYYH